MEISFGEHRYKQEQPNELEVHFVAYGIIMAFGRRIHNLVLQYARLSLVEEIM
jgi:hypothetical protein